ncbi:TPA: GNAT family N-acetyltransferase [Legionella pneumophila]|nr:GNAT family N-acetyltransferase [Legionella pneumophila]HCJ1112920.1 GNAT family N-acetyltransferase [Legionella pneumophila]
MTKIFIRAANFDDAEDISKLIIKTLQESNIKDYSTKIIEEVIESFSPTKITSRMAQRQIFIAIEQNQIIGTASLEDNMVRSVFVLPSKQMKKIGLQLMNHLENIAKEQNIQHLTVPSSITAEAFYRKLGYKTIGEEYYGEERTIIMEKHI